MTQKELVDLAGEKGYERFHPDYFENEQLEPDTWYLELCLLQKWLRDTHKFHIYISTTPTFDKTQGSKWKSVVDVPFQPFRWTTGHYYLGESYEESLEKGLFEALKLISYERKT